MIKKNHFLFLSLYISVFALFAFFAWGIYSDGGSVFWAGDIKQASAQAGTPRKETPPDQAKINGGIALPNKSSTSSVSSLSSSSSPTSVSTQSANTSQNQVPNNFTPPTEQTVRSGGLQAFTIFLIFLVLISSGVVMIKQQKTKSPLKTAEKKLK